MNDLYKFLEDIFSGLLYILFRLIGVFSYYSVIWVGIYAPIFFGPLVFLHNNIDLSKGKFALVSVLYLIVAIRVVIPLNTKINGWIYSIFEKDMRSEEEAGELGCLFLFLGVVVYLLVLFVSFVYTEW